MKIIPISALRLTILIITNLFVVIIFNGCSKKSEKDEPFKINENSKNNFFASYKSNGYLLNFNSKVNNSNYTSLMQIFKDNKLVLETNYVFDALQLDYRLQQHKEVIRKAKILDIRYIKKNELEKISGEIEVFINKCYSNINHNDNTLQSFLYHWSIINVKRRFLQTNNYECSPHPGYILGKNNFVAQEDFFIEKKIILNVFKEQTNLISDTKSKKLFDYLMFDNKENSIRFDKYYSFYVNPSDFNFTIENILSSNLKKNNENIKQLFYSILKGNVLGIVF